MSYRSAYCRNLGSSACRKERSVSVSRDCRCACSGDSWASTASHSVSTLSNDIDSIVTRVLCWPGQRASLQYCHIITIWLRNTHHHKCMHIKLLEIFHISENQFELIAILHYSSLRQPQKWSQLQKTFFRNIVHNFSCVTINSSQIRNQLI